MNRILLAFLLVLAGIFRPALSFAEDAPPETESWEESVILVPEEGICAPTEGKGFLGDFSLAGRGCCSRHGGMSGRCQDGRVVCNDGTLSPTCRCFFSEPVEALLKKIVVN